MTKFSFKAYDQRGDLIFIGCDSALALCLESMGYEIKRFWDGVLI